MASKLMLRPLVENIAHKDQLEVWAEELTFAISDWLKEPESYDDKVRLARAVQDEIRRIVEVVLERVCDASTE